MKQEDKAILYSFKQLSMRYSPDLQPDSASKQLMRWVMYHPDLKQKLENAGWHKGATGVVEFRFNVSFSRIEG